MACLDLNLSHARASQRPEWAQVERPAMLDWSPKTAVVVCQLRSSWLLILFSCLRWVDLLSLHWATRWTSCWSCSPCLRAPFESIASRLVFSLWAHHARPNCVLAPVWAPSLPGEILDSKIDHAFVVVFINTTNKSYFSLGLYRF